MTDARLAGYRNLLLGILTLVVAGEVVWVAGPEHATELGPTFAGLAAVAASLIGGRALNKLATRGGKKSE